jgi:hypothetical protein
VLLEIDLVVNSLTPLTSGLPEFPKEDTTTINGQMHSGASIVDHESNSSIPRLQLDGHDSESSFVTPTRTSLLWRRLNSRDVLDRMPADQGKDDGWTEPQYMQPQ